MIFPLSYAAASYPETAVYVGGFGTFFAIGGICMGGESMKKQLSKKNVLKITIVLFLLLVFTAALIFFIISSMFAPLHKAELSEVQIMKYENGTYRELVISDKESLNNLYQMKNDIIQKATVINSKLRKADTFQKDSEFSLKYIYENGEHQTIEITESIVIIFNCCSPNEYPKFYLYNKSSDSDISLSRDALTDYILWLYYEN